MNLKKIYILLFLISVLCGCSSNSIKEKINKAGDVAGQTAGEFIEGASKGVQKAFDVEVHLPKELKDKGIEFGKATVSNDTIGTDNLLVLYVIFNENYEGKLTAKVFDEKSLEIGRSIIETSGKKGEAKHVEFHFDKFTNIDSKNKVIVE